MLFRSFEAVTGQPLLNLLHQHQPWCQVRFWLLDLANEINDAEKDGTLPTVLALDRVWITADGRAKLLDFPAPGIVSRASQREAENPSHHKTNDIQRFLASVAYAALEGRIPDSSDTEHKTITAPLPLHARSFLDKLPVLGSEAIIAALKPLLQKSTTVSRWRRAGLVAGCIAFPLIVAVAALAGTYMMDKIQRNQPDIMQLSSLLNHRKTMHMLPAQLTGKRRLSDRAYSIYIASHFRQTITNASSWTGFFAMALITGPNRRFAEESVATYPNPTEQETSEATKVVQPHLPKTHANYGEMNSWHIFAAVIGVTLLIYVCIPALLAALLFRGGLLLYAFGIAIIRKDGIRASRLRVFWRSLIAWSPVLVAPLALVLPIIFGIRLDIIWGAGLVFILVVVSAIVSVTLPNRSLQDRIAGTWLVPR